MPALAAYPLAALAEIAGCFAICTWWRLGATPFWILPGGCALLAFGWLLAQVDATVAALNNIDLISMCRRLDYR